MWLNWEIQPKSRPDCFGKRLDFFQESDVEPNFGTALVCAVVRPLTSSVGIMKHLACVYAQVSWRCMMGYWTLFHHPHYLAYSM